MHLARAHVACADAMISAGEDLPGALEQLEEAEGLLGPRAGGDDLAVIRRLQSACAVGAGDAVLAERWRSRPWRSPARRRARAASRGGRSPRLAPRPARPTRTTRSGEAIGLLGGHGSVRDHAGVLRSYGRFLRDAGREREALGVFERAAEVASNLQAEPASAER